MKRHKYISPTKIGFYWFDNFYIRIQHETWSLPPYALIQTIQTHYTEKDFQELEKRNALQEISNQEFLEAYAEAKEIIENMIASIA